MEKIKVIRIVKISAILVIIFGIMGIGLSIYNYNKMRLKIGAMNYRLDTVYLEVDSEISNISRVLLDTETILYNFAENGNFSQPWWEPFPDIEEDILFVADSFNEYNNELDEKQGELEEVKDNIKEQVTQIEGELLRLTIHSSLLHMVLVLIGVSFFLVSGIITQEPKVEKIEPQKVINDVEDVQTRWIGSEEILRRRLVKGEVSPEEYREIEKLLKGEE